MATMIWDVLCMLLGAVIGVLLGLILTGTI